MRARFEFYGVAVEVSSECASAVELLRRDLRWFHVPGPAPAEVRLELVEEHPPWEQVPSRRRPLFRTNNNVVYRRGALRYVDHQGAALGVFDLARDRGTVHSEDPGQLYAVAYLMALSRVGRHLDRRGLHRVHALGVHLDGRAWLFLGRSGLGKTTLGLEFMKDPRAGWLSDEIPIVDRSGLVRAFPLPPRVNLGAPVPWPAPPPALEPVPRAKDPPKLMMDVGVILPRVVPQAPLGGVFVCRRAGDRPRLRRLGAREAFFGLADNAVLGRDFPQTKAYFLPLAPRALLAFGRDLSARTAWCLGVASRVPVFGFELGPDPEANVAAAVRAALGAPTAAPEAVPC